MFMGHFSDTGRGILGSVRESRRSINNSALCFCSSKMVSALSVQQTATMHFRFEGPPSCRLIRSPEQTGTLSSDLAASSSGRNVLTHFEVVLAHVLRLDLTLFGIAFHQSVGERVH